MSTHIVSDIESVADSVIIMKEGGIAVSGSVGEPVSALPDGKQSLENLYMLHFGETNEDDQT